MKITTKLVPLQVALRKGRVQQEAVAYLERALIEVTHLTAGRDRCIGISLKKPPTVTFCGIAQDDENG